MEGAGGGQHANFQGEEGRTSDDGVWSPKSEEARSDRPSLRKEGRSHPARLDHRIEVSNRKKHDASSTHINPKCENDDNGTGARPTRLI